LPAGDYTVTQMSFAGNATYAPTSVALTQRFGVPKTAQSISFAPLPGKTEGDPDFGVFANQWYFARIGGVWYGGAGEWIYRGAGACKAGQGTETIGPDSGFGEPFASWKPRVGELVGYAVTSVARRGVRRTVDQRTQIVVQPWRDTSRGSAGMTLGLDPPGAAR
jgi:hypothetical protein